MKIITTLALLAVPAVAHAHEAHGVPHPHAEYVVPALWALVAVMAGWSLWRHRSGR